MTEQSPEPTSEQELATEILARLVDGLPLRVEHVVIFTTPHGGTVEYTADGEDLALIMALSLDRDARAAGIDDVDVSAVRRTWALADEEEILTTRPADSPDDPPGEQQT